MINNLRQTISFLFMLLIGGAVLFVGYRIVYTSLETANSDALYGGEVEIGYPAAGYLIAYDANGGTSTCGFAVLNESIGVTAAHCVDHAIDMRVGKGRFSYVESDNIAVSKAVQREGWVANQNRSQDFAVLHFSDSTYFTDFATIAEPVEGCLYRVVAYGRTEDAAESVLKPRKSAVICADQINSTTFQVVGEQSGICFGDSGSAVFVNGTDQLVGLIASIVKDSSADEANPCALGNRAIVVRADAHQRIINENIQEVDTSASDIGVEEALIVEVADQTFLESIGLEEFENLTEAEKAQYLVNALIVTIVLLVLAIIWVATRPEKPTYVEDIDEFSPPNIYA